jgi:UDP-GlcNAc:undecaprenyl-phosphate GlcNAc-1-phosphate transferase
MGFLAVFFSSVAVTLAMIPLCIRLARRSDFLDYPSALKIHSNPTPLLGGLAVFVGFWAALLVGTATLRLPLDSDILGLFLGASLIVGIGLADDKKGLSPSHKLLGQIIAALVFLTASPNAKILTGSGWDLLILVLWIVGLMNAVNFLDAMDGLCAGISFISAGAFLVIAIFDQQIYSIILALALMGGLLGFLRYNWSPAKIFLGDAGSMFNGFILACLGILFARGNPSYSSLLVPILILSYPIFDISFVTLVRLREGRKVYVGDYNNSPRRIASLGMQNKKVVLWIYLICFLLGSLAIFVYFFFDSPVKMLIAVFVWLTLVIFGVHLQRNFVNIREKLFLILCDTLVINAVFLFFFWTRFHSGLFGALRDVPLSEFVAPAVWITVFWLNLFAVMGLYEIPGDSRHRDEWRGIVKATAAGIALFLVLSFDPSHLQIRSWILILIYGLSLVIALGLARSLFAYLIRKFNFLRACPRRGIIVGTGPRAKQLFEDLSTNPEYGYHMVGFVRPDTGRQPPDPRDCVDKLPGKMLGGIQDLDDVARENRVQDVLIGVDPDWNGSLQEIMDSIHNLEVSFKIASDSGDLKRGYRTEPLRSKHLSRIFPSQLRSWEWLLKRLFDGFVSLAILVLFLPLWILIGLLVRLTFGASALVRQKHLGKSGREIRLGKFRVSGEVGAKSAGRSEEIPQSGLGRFLRSTGLERVPMLVNALRGEISLIGPEPLSPETFRKLSTDLPLLPKRLNVKPGLLSLAKIKRRLRSYTEAPRDNLRDDLFYVENMSLLLDLRILIRGAIGIFKR